MTFARPRSSGRRCEVIATDVVHSGGVQRGLRDRPFAATSTAASRSVSDRRRCVRCRDPNRPLCTTTRPHQLSPEPCVSMPLLAVVAVDDIGQEPTGWPRGGPHRGRRPSDGSESSIQAVAVARPYPRSPRNDLVRSSLVMAAIIASGVVNVRRERAAARQSGHRQSSQRAAHDRFWTLATSTPRARGNSSSHVTPERSQRDGTLDPDPVRRC